MSANSLSSRSTLSGTGFSGGGGDAASSSSPKDYVYWLGHATILLCVKGVNIIIDPMFSERASPVQFFGPKRRYPCATTIEELPPMDIVLVTHNHYDHLDAYSIKALYERFPNILMITPLNMDRLLTGFGVPEKQIITLDWWEEISVMGVTLACVPAHHWSWHDLLDRDEILWCGWIVGWNLPRDGGRFAPNVSRIMTNPFTVVEQNQPLNQSTLGSRTSNTSDFLHSSAYTDSVTKTLSSSATTMSGTTPHQHHTSSELIHWESARTFYFTGDTAFNQEMFEQIHHRYPRIDLAALPIGAYAPREVCYTEHVDPEHAVKIFQILKVRKAFGVHWGAFELSSEPLDEPIEVLKRTLEKESISNADFQLIRTGDFISFDRMGEWEEGSPMTTTTAATEDDDVWYTAAAAVSDSIHAAPTLAPMSPPFTDMRNADVGRGCRIQPPQHRDENEDTDDEENLDLINSFWSQSTSTANVSATSNHHKNNSQTSILTQCMAP